MEFRRIDNLPPYVFAEVNHAKLNARRAGEDIVDLGFGNPDIGSAPFVVDKLIEAAKNERNHRYSVSRGLPNLRKAVSDRYRRRFGVELDPDTEVISTIGAKEGLSHLLWTLVQPGDARPRAVLSDPTRRYWRAPRSVGRRSRPRTTTSKCWSECSATRGPGPG